MDDSHYLQGGREDDIIKQGNTVHRPTGPWTKQVHALLRHLRKKGFYAAPKPLGFDAEGREIVRFKQGEVSNYPLTHNAASTKALITAAELLRNFHDASQSFLTETSPREKYWQLPPREPQEVICHGDYAPYNIVLHGETAIGIIDFDTCHPGPRLWDIAYALYRWAPFTNPHNQDGFGSIEEQIKRGRLFCQSYGLVNKERPALANLMVERLQALVDFMIAEAQSGNKTVALNMQNNHHLLYLADIKYVRKHLTNIGLGLID